MRKKKQKANFFNVVNFLSFETFLTSENNGLVRRPFENNYEK
jgi:hypothetical protein